LAVFIITESLPQQWTIAGQPMTNGQMHGKKRVEENIPDFIFKCPSLSGDMIGASYLLLYVCLSL